MKFRNSASSSKTVNKAGGEAFKENSKLELVSLLLTSFVNDKFYEGKTEQLDRLKELVNGISDKQFIAKAAVYARTEFGMRSITHALIGELVKKVKGEQWTKYAIEKTYYRPDDGLEMLGYYLSKYGKPIPNALKKGLALGIKKFKPYQLAKYRGDNSNIKLVDLFNLTHAKPSEVNSEAVKALMRDELKSTGNNSTWESKLTQAGQNAENEDEKLELKKNAWKELILEKKLGYFALLRNLRNISQQAPEVLDEALEQLVNAEAIRKSLVLPFRFATAMNEIIQESGSRKIISALSKAIDISLSNVPVFPGKTLIMLDTSGSMVGKPREIGNLFAAALAKSNDADLIVFSDKAKYENINPADSLLTIARGITFYNSGTDFNLPFKVANRKYDRIILLSDMQGWMGYYAPTKEFNEYKKRTGANPHIYSFDLNGYGTLEFPEKQVYCIAGFSEKVFDIMKLLEEDRNALISKIDSIKLM
jgi:hypothetical protein